MVERYKPFLYLRLQPNPSWTYRDWEPNPQDPSAPFVRPHHTSDAYLPPEQQHLARCAMNMKTLDAHMGLYVKPSECQGSWAEALPLSWRRSAALISLRSPTLQAKPCSLVTTLLAPIRYGTVLCLAITLL